MAVFPQGNTSDYQPTAYVAGGVIKASAGRLFKIYGYNSKASGQFIQIFDSPTLPAEAAVPKIILPVATVASFELDLGDLGRGFTTGIYWTNSSTGPTKTIGTTDVWLNATYR